MPKSPWKASKTRKWRYQNRPYKTKAERYQQKESKEQEDTWHDNDKAVDQIMAVRIIPYKNIINSVAFPSIKFPGTSIVTEYLFGEPKFYHAFLMMKFYQAEITNTINHGFQTQRFFVNDHPITARNKPISFSSTIVYNNSTAILMESLFMNSEYVICLTDMSSYPGVCFASPLGKEFMYVVKDSPSRWSIFLWHDVLEYDECTMFQFTRYDPVMKRVRPTTDTFVGKFLSTFNIYSTPISP